MFHIKDDKRSQKSAELLVKAFDDCLKEHDFYELTVKELCIVSTVGRATFYRLFDRIEDIVSYKFSMLTDGFVKDFQPKSSKEAAVLFFKMWMENIDFLLLLIKLGKQGLFYEAHMKYLDSLKTEFLHLGRKVQLDEYTASVLSSVLLGMLIAWAKKEKREGAEEIVEKMKTVLLQTGNIFDEKK